MILNPEICAEIFGPCVILVAYESREELLRLLSKLDGQLTGTILGERSDIVLQEVLSIFSKICGRVIFDGVPTGVNVLATMQHGGPYPSSSDVRFTAVGEKSVWRFARAVTFQNF
jgi:NADP-dependent aldehyde dehydrogenase